MFKKTLLNFLMIQFTMFLISLSLGNQWGQFTTSGTPVAIGFFYIILFIYSFFPSLLVSLMFAIIQKRFYEGRIS